MTVGYGDNELDRVLRKTFGRVDPRKAGLGDVNPSDIGLSPGVMYAGGPQTGPSGQGRQASKYKKKLEQIFDGIDLSKCGPLANEDCAELISRILEQTFRNFQLTARPPSHVEPPFPSVPIDVFGPVGGVALVAAAAYVDICAFTMPTGLYRGEILAAGQCLESANAFDDVEWRITVDAQPYQPWIDFSKHLWDFLPPTKLASHIPLQGGQRIALQARALVNNHTADGRLTGWNYLMRANVGGNTAQSTLVD